MKQRKLGSTDLSVSEVGFGSWQLGNTTAWKGVQEDKAVQLVHEAVDHGCNFFDTAPNYAGGKSEKILGRALSDRREEVVISTKFGHFPDGTQNYSAGLIRDSVENSLKALKTDYLDSVLLHNPPVEYLDGSRGHFEILEELKQEGKIKSYGASIDSSEEIFTLIENTDSQVIEVLFNIFHQEPKRAFDWAKKAGVGFIVKVPLDSGWLTGKYDQDSNFSDIRDRWSDEVINRRASLVEKIKDIKPKKESLVQEALRFVLSFSAVSSVIPGIKNQKQLKENLSAAEVELPEDRKKEYENFFADNIAGDPLPW